jgi:hypothetical protein
MEILSPMPSRQFQMLLQTPVLINQFNHRHRPSNLLPSISFTVQIQGAVALGDAALSFNVVEVDYSSRYQPYSKLIKHQMIEDEVIPEETVRQMEEGGEVGEVVVAIMEETHTNERRALVRQSHRNLNEI